MEEEDTSEKGIKDAIGFVSEPYVFSYSFKEAIVYALAVGVSTQDTHGLRWDSQDTQCLRIGHTGNTGHTPYSA